MPMVIISVRKNKVVANVETVIVKCAIVNFSIDFNRLLNFVLFDAVYLTNFF